MKSAARKTPDIELLSGRDYEVIRGKTYRYHDEGSCGQCAFHPMGEVLSWPKLHSTVQAGAHPIHAPLAMSAPPFEMRLVVVPKFEGSRSFSKRETARVQGLGGMGWSIGDVFSDIWGFIQDVVNAIIDAVVAVVEAVVNAIMHPLDTLKAVFRASIDFFTGATFLHWMEVFPVTRWIYQGVDYITGGFLSNIKTLESLPGRFVSGEPITRQDLLKALTVVKVGLIIAIGVFTGGATLAIIGATAGVLKAGPIGKTALGRTLLDIAAITAGAIAGDGDIIGAFADAGVQKLKEMGVKEAAARAGVSSLVAGLVAIGVGKAVKAGTSSSSDDEEELEDEIEDVDASTDTDAAFDTEGEEFTDEDYEMDFDDEEFESDGEISPIDEAELADAEIAEMELQATEAEMELEEDYFDEEFDDEELDDEEFDEEFDDEELDDEEESEGDDSEEDEEDGEEEEEEDEEDEESEDEEDDSGLTDQEIASILKVGLSVTNLAITLLKDGKTPRQVRSAVKKAKQIIVKEKNLTPPTSTKKKKKRSPSSTSTTSTSDVELLSQNDLQALKSKKTLLFVGASLAAFALLASRKKKS